MARLKLPPSPSTFSTVKREPDADTTPATDAQTPRPPPYKKRRRDGLPVTPTQLLLTPQTIPSCTPASGFFKYEGGEEPGLTPATAPTSFKREPDADSGNNAGRNTLRPSPPHKKRHLECIWATPTQPLFTPQTIPSGTSRADSFLDKQEEQLDLTPATTPASQDCVPDGYTSMDAGRNTTGRRQPYRRPPAAEAPTLWVNRGRLGHLLHELVRTQRWRDAAGVFSTLLPGTRQPDSFEDTRSMFVAAMEILRRLDKDSSMQLGTRSPYYLRTQKIFDVWMRRLLWLPTCAKKYLVKVELALFYLSQGNIDNAYNATKILIGKGGLQIEPTLNLIHGLISFDKWYSALPKDMQLKELDIYDESCTTSMASNGFGEKGLQDSSDDNCSIDVDDASLPACSSESSINNGNIDKKMKIPKKSCFIHPVKESDSLGSQVNEEMVYTDFRSIFFNTSNGPTCGLEKSLLPLRLKHADGTSNNCFDLYWKYKSTPNSFYEDAEKCLRVAVHSTPPVMAALLPLIQILLLGDKLKDALAELEKACRSSTAALPFRLRGRLLEYFDENQVSTISSCYEEALRIDPTCSYSVERLTKMHKKGYYNTVQLVEAIALHLDSVNGKPFIWEELISCFLRLFSDRTTDYEDCVSCNVQGDASITAVSNFLSVFFEQRTRETWKRRCRWWMNHHFCQDTYTSETLKGDCKLLASKAACASHLFGPRFPYVKAVKSYLSAQEAYDEIGFLSRNIQHSVQLLQGPVLLGFSSGLFSQKPPSQI